MDKSVFFPLLAAVLLATGGWAAEAAAERNSIASLRASIAFMMETYGNGYPRGAEYLQRLESLSDNTTPAFTNLQREALLDHPHVRGYPWLVEVRSQYWGNHGPINTMFQNGDLHGNGVKNFHGNSARLEIIAFEGGKAVRKKVLAEEPEGILRDADVSFDGKRILYSRRENQADDYHLYEMDLTSGAVQQLTFGRMISDVDPIYAPGGRIIFSSTRDPKFCQCNKHISNNLFAMDADGANIEQVSFNDLADFHSSLMQNGTVLYSRWEYVDRHFGPSLGLWTTNPDGTRHALYMGNNAWSPGFIGDAREIPGTDKVVCIYGACHDLPWGAMAVVDRSRGMDGPEPIVHMWPEEARSLVSPDDDAYNRDLQYRRDVDKMRPLKVRYEDPYPIHNLAKGDGGGHYFFVSKTKYPAVNSYANRERKPEPMALMLCDVFGNEVAAYQLEDGPLSPYGAVPIAPRREPPAIPSPVDYSKKSGFLYVNNCYLGNRDEMVNVKPGSIKYLRVVEAPPRRVYDEVGNWNVDAQQVGAMNWNLTNNKQILGDVPVEQDGSAYFEIPADTFVQFLALDKDKHMIQAMRSGTVVRPGETQGCIGCHENRLQAPSAANPMPLAMRRPPSQLEPWFGVTDVDAAKPFNYLTDVQPVFDRHCVSCHDYGKEAGEVLNLCGDLSLPFNVSYTELMAKSGHRYSGPEEKMVNFVGDGPPGVLPAYAWGSHRSKLVRVLKEGHYDVKLSKEEMQRITSWIDINAVYYGRYESFYRGRNPLLALPDGKKKMELVLGGRKSLNEIKPWVLDHGHLVNFTRPGFSPCLKMIDDPAQRELALACLKEAQSLLARRPRIDQVNEVLTLAPMDRHYSDRYAATRTELGKSIEAIIKGEKYFQFKAP